VTTDERSGCNAHDRRGLRGACGTRRHSLAGAGGSAAGDLHLTLTTRLSTFGLADIRGAVHAGFDEGAWISTAQTAAQMLIAPIAI